MRSSSDCKTPPVILALVLTFLAGCAWAVDIPTEFSNTGTVRNTRHNMTQRQAVGGPDGGAMDNARNNYGEVCVYCHTPHGANTTVNLPLWNRTIKATTYTTYDQLGTVTLTQAISQPGAASLACLSCHDGQTAMDSVINMPGSGRYDAGQMTAQNNAFLNTWPSPAVAHGTLALPAVGSSCLGCHQTTNPFVTDFTVYAIGTDLKDDHPIGIDYPADATRFNAPGGVSGTVKYFDANSNAKIEPKELRVYDTGSGAKVECASCHDPHGVPSAGAGSTFIPSFLRVNNTGSTLCLVCHSV